METGVLFEHFDEIEATTATGLSPIRPELESDPGYTETDETCPVEGCDGSLWDKRGEAICGQCSAIKDGSITSISVNTDQWRLFQDHRPHYHTSGNARLAGSFNLAWIEESETDRPISDVDAESFYQF